MRKRNSSPSPLYPQSPRKPPSLKQPIQNRMLNRQKKSLLNRKSKAENLIRASRNPNSRVRKKPQLSSRLRNRLNLKTSRKPRPGLLTRQRPKPGRNRLRQLSLKLKNPALKNPVEKSLPPKSPGRTSRKVRAPAKTPSQPSLKRLRHANAARNVQPNRKVARKNLPRRLNWLSLLHRQSRSRQNPRLRSLAMPRAFIR